MPRHGNSTQRVLLAERGGLLFAVALAEVLEVGRHPDFGKIHFMDDSPCAGSFILHQQPFTLIDISHPKLGTIRNSMVLNLPETAFFAALRSDEPLALLLDNIVAVRALDLQTSFQPEFAVGRYPWFSRFVLIDESQYPLLDVAALSALKDSWRCELGREAYD